MVNTKTQYGSEHIQTEKTLMHKTFHTNLPRDT